MTGSSSKTLAIFDFDGTITWFDSYPFFLIATAPPSRLFKQSFSLAGALFSYASGKRNAQATKEIIMTSLYKGMSESDYLRRCKLFARLVLPRFIRPAARKRIAYHRAKGHTLIILSASFAEYLAPWAKKQGFSYVLATATEIRKGRVSGKIEGKNCSGKQKCVVLQKTFGSLKKYETYGYGNSSEDKFFLSMMNHQYYRSFSQ